MTTISYHLNFRAPLHIGERGVGLEESRTFASADTLFSALCVMWRELYGVTKLEKELLPAFQTDAPPLLLTSAFPYAGSVRFYPRPLGAKVKGDGKAWRKVRFVSERRFAQLAQGETLTLEKAHCLNDGAVWVDDADLPELRAWQRDGDYRFWQHAVTPRVTLDRITSASALWQLGGVSFNAGCGLWFAARCQSDWQAPLETALRLLGDTGLGGERGAGYGLFSVARREPLTLPDLPNAEQFITLSPCAPASAAQLQALTQQREVQFNLSVRRGWAGSPAAGNLRRQEVWMFDEGSLLAGSGGANAGRLVNVKPLPEMHDVWRYGFAFPVGVKPCANV